MKLQLMLSPLAAVAVAALTACSGGSGAPTSAANPPAPAPAEVAPAPESESLSSLPDQLTAEEIQARREAWVSGASTPAGEVAERIAAAPAPVRE